MNSLLEKLVQDQHISDDQAKVVRIESVRTGKPVSRILCDSEFFPAELLDEYHLGATSLALSAETFVPDLHALQLLTEDTARRYNVLPVAFNTEKNILELAMDDTSNIVVCDRLRREIPDPVKLIFRRSAATEIKRTLDKCYGACHSLAGILDELEQAAIAKPSSNEINLTPVVRLVDAILQDAVISRASDIHLSPQSLFVSVRYRIDGVLNTACCIHICYWSAMLVRIKVLSEIDIAETRLPQDGHVVRTIHGQRIDFRVASFPVRGGENLVLRVLDRRRGVISLATVCFDHAVRNKLALMVKQPGGLLLVCGPTGSGKTTTLYAWLQSLDAAVLNIMTLEDPIEYPIAGIRQTRVQGNSAISYADGVKAVLRQDPDVIMIGEVRDKSSCVMACRAAMTGHLVLTSTHANDCIGAIQRLIELGATRAVLANVLIGVVSQRLIRKTCPHCHGQSESCGSCNRIGYIGRIPLFECLNVSAEFSKLLYDDAAREVLLAQANKDGTSFLADEAAKQVSVGNTTEKEVERVLGLARPGT